MVGKFSELKFGDLFSRLSANGKYLFLAACVTRVSAQFDSYWSRRPPGEFNPASQVSDFLWKAGGGDAVWSKQDIKALSNMLTRLVEEFNALEDAPEYARPLPGEHCVLEALFCYQCAILFMESSKIEDAEGVAEGLHSAAHQYSMLLTHRLYERVDEQRIAKEGSAQRELVRQERDLKQLADAYLTNDRWLEDFKARAYLEKSMMFPEEVGK